ncbi:class I SAM-dependent methyltransferase [Pseudoclavibacter sp. 13-3]|uniref:class I SAM-dependent methyltransferase n=1 Tax=Pseudoclavibacter sp. 13-3 TaxID=2901228 RepID=UPI001E36F4D3|nr:methyltransferase [Pseudoclavibacter sp. 13-3]MCD7102288.1 class I SAM-dependent methyltransferase [Pseudoclavibacter sp. 13-3]
MAHEHYFAEHPHVAAHWRDIDVDLDGRTRTVAVASGLFSPDGLDKATRILLDRVPEPPQTGEALDIGCGWGPIALTLALRAPQTRVWAVDVNERAREATARNADHLGLDRIVVASPEDVPADLGFDVIWANPPIRIGKQALHALLLTWLPRLAPCGEAWLVVGKQLGADSLQRWLADELPGAFDVRRAATARGFRVIHIRRDA